MDQMTLALTLRQANSMEVFADGEFWRMYGDLKLVRVDSPKEADVIVITHKMSSDRHEKRTG